MEALKNVKIVGSARQLVRARMSSMGEPMVSYETTDEMQRRGERFAEHEVKGHFAAGVYLRRMPQRPTP